MSRLVIAGAALCAAVLVAWVAAGPRLVSLLDRLGTAREATLPVGDYGIDSNVFLIGRHGWWLGKTLLVAPDSQKRVTVSRKGRAFTLGPVTGCYASADPEYEFIPDPDDRISFVKSHSWIAWPIPFKFSILGGAVPSWKRHAYNRLTWIKASGAKLELVWRDEEVFFRGSGWTDGNLQIAPAVTITPGRPGA